eukprot:3677272-Lingulodinium_polyedra.AAC.1
MRHQQRRSRNSGHSMQNGQVNSETTRTLPTPNNERNRPRADPWGANMHLRARSLVMAQTYATRACSLVTT